ncbi:polysaccharide deacetylase [Sporanaerobium hydrogeniformans]|uniref:Polysaccharide deacetylase n=1 Tax=Sporanaerobium hydrogeniformans TaxID=3072179 RepID=A0AC61DCY7_9FIRM|nr:polysaccharide deacetylase family protein [Sporanaerobium hydrogeniformans]PHV70432.1 polysaccharide deacetylase [Sporanaerobium hydrogeniformans]
MKKAYLTIDDGPSAFRKERVDILKKYDIQAIWFSSGEYLLKREEEAIYTIKNGGVIGNHSYNHPHFSAVVLEECYQQIKRTDEIIEALYKEAGVERPIKAFRFPYGDKGVEKAFYDLDYSFEEKKRVEAIQGFLKELGYQTLEFKDIHYGYFQRLKEKKHIDWYWTYDAMEWCIFQERPPYGIKTLEDILELMEIDLPERWMGLNNKKSNEIIVVHDHDQTLEFFEPIIKAFLDKGINFKKYTKDMRH